MRKEDIANLGHAESGYRSALNQITDQLEDTAMNRHLTATLENCFYYVMAECQRRGVALVGPADDPEPEARTFRERTAGERLEGELLNIKNLLSEIEQLSHEFGDVNADPEQPDTLFRIIYRLASEASAPFYQETWDELLEAVHGENQ